MSSGETMGAGSSGLADAGLPELGRQASILERTAHGAAWVIGWRIATRALGIISTLILARLLAQGQSEAPTGTGNSMTPCSRSDGMIFLRYWRSSNACFW